ncbi:hypothetical protein BDN70DRAFT_578607 [Pholiota conissans]|uniref:Uncharacterized protein n=1 Tax=Pholiota conissans TaxID=109636 RepID=A0A9P5YP32_9AGAR|nr:hypothetical protein BDN70DRAFT_578607 [Pholiota conissans]
MEIPFQVSKYRDCLSGSLTICTILPSYSFSAAPIAGLLRLITTRIFCNLLWGDADFSSWTSMRRDHMLFLASQSENVL